MAYTLLGAHVNSTVSGLPETIKTWKPPLVVLLDHSDVWHDVKAESPDTVFVGRVFFDSEPDFNQPGLDPLKAAHDHCEKILPWAERMGETYSFWQGVNEPIINSPEAMQRYAAFEAERARIMDGDGFRVVVGSFSVGNPQLPFWREFLPALEAALQYQGALALHEYAWPTLDRDAEWYILRHRKVYDGAPDHDWAGLPAHLKSLPLLVTECGLDGLIEQGSPPRGWKVRYGDDPAEYLRQLRWYDAELRQDPYVAGAAIYCVATPDSRWNTYDIWPNPAQTMAHKATPIYRLSPDQPEEPQEPPVEPAEPAQPPPGEWEMKVETRPGPRLIVGSLPTAGIPVTVTDPWGNATTAISGSKPEYGVGGFEVLASHAATYTISFLQQRFQVQVGDATIVLTFTKAEEPVEPPQEPAEPIEQPPEGPTEPAEQPPEGPTEPPDEDAMLDAVLERLDRIIAALQARL